MRPHHLSLSCPVLEDSFAKEVNKFHNGAFETVPNKDHGHQDNHNLCRSWVYPEQPMNFRSSLDRSLDFSNNGNIFQLPPKSNNDFSTLMKVMIMLYEVISIQFHSFTILN
jgi:hypothetical protein